MSLARWSLDPAGQNLLAKFEQSMTGEIGFIVTASKLNPSMKILDRAKMVSNEQYILNIRMMI